MKSNLQIFGYVFGFVFKKLFQNQDHLDFFLAIFFEFYTVVFYI